MADDVRGDDFRARDGLFALDNRPPTRQRSLNRLFVAIGLGLIAHYHALDGARFVQNALEEAPDGGLAQRTAIGPLRRSQNFALAVGLIQRRAAFLLQPAALQPTT